MACPVLVADVMMAGCGGLGASGDDARGIAGVLTVLDRRRVVALSFFTPMNVHWLLVLLMLGQVRGGTRG